MTEAISRGPDFTNLMLTWLAFIAALLALFVCMFLWGCFGKEIIELNPTTLRYTRKIPIFSYRKEYPVADVSGLRLIPFPWNKERNHSLFGFRNRIIAFDYRHRTHRMGSGLDEANAHYVIQKMRERLKSLAANNEAG